MGNFNQTQAPLTGVEYGNRIGAALAIRAEQDAENIRRCEAYLEEAAKARAAKRAAEKKRKDEAFQARVNALAAASCPAPPPMAGDKPKAPASKPATVQAPPRKWLPDGTYRAVPGKGLVRVDDDRLMRNFY